ncbi:MAG: hypothetical protein FWE04_08465, partial [Oscillospiraceae bacterium]|nr:hypothetical protein [Oscillospiraceae bacterium]
ATNPVPQTPPVCTNHNWNDRGFCTRCGAEFRINITAVSGRRYITRDDVPVRARPYAPEAAIRRYNRGRAVNVNGRGRNSQGNIWYRLTDGTWIYSGNLSMTNPTAPTCTNHNWNDRGFCTRCGAEFRIGITTISPAQARFTTRADVPVRARPYAPEPILRRLANGTRVMVNGRGRNSQGNIWYRLTDGTWIYSGNLRR